MKKTFWGKITFLLACVFVIIYIFVKICNLWILGVTFEGWNNIIDMSLSIRGYGTVRIISENFVVPIICCIVCLIYIFEIGRNKLINRFVFVVTALAIFVEMLFYILDNINRDNMIPFLPLLLRIGFFLAFVLFIMGGLKNYCKKILYVVLGCSFVGTAIYLVMHYKHNLTAIIQNTEYLQGIQIIYMYSEYFILPILGLVVCGLVICYTLFPEKYFKSAN